MSDLQQKFAVAGELKQLVISSIVAAQPYIAGRINVDTMLVFGPVVSCPGATPCLQHIAFAIKLNHGRCGNEAFETRWCKGCCAFVFTHSTGTMNDPDMMIAVSGDTSHLTQNPVIGQWLGPVWIDGIARAGADRSFNTLR